VRDRVWQGIRDWFRPVDDGASTVSRRSGRGSRSDRASRYGLQNSGAAARTRSADPSRQDSGQKIFPSRVESFGQGFGDGGGAGEATLALSPDVAIDERELLDFIAADVDPVPADPAFRERLREELWEMVVVDGLVKPSGS